MNPVTRVDLHCHSTFSDGALSPEQLAERLAAAGVAFASLTDHDTVDGLAGFRQAAGRAGIGVINGLELTVCCDGREAHLLAYGFDPAHPDLRATLRSLQLSRPSGVHSIASSIRERTLRQNPPAEGQPENGTAVDGRLDISDAIALVHRAGGLAFLAHPMMFEPTPEKLRALLVRLKDLGLDGIEAIYGPSDAQWRDRLCAMARELGLLVSAGTDLHDGRSAGQVGPGIDMPTDLWKQLRDAVRPATGAGDPASFETLRPQSYRPKWRQFAFHIACPSLLAIGLFIAAIYAVFLPTLERSLMDRKREMIRELTNSAWSLLAEAETQEQAGLLTRDQAQALAKARIESLRYGRERKDYFWLQDMHPRMVMHPYRTDLNNQDVSDFRDPRGVRLFVEMADLVRRRQEGYIEYVWQWKDDPLRLAPKESYVRGFEPWGWIIGTGIYVEDVNQEIARIEQNLVRASLVIAALVAALLLYVTRQSLWLERQRSRAEESRHEWMERYRSLVEATTEGTLLVLENRCRYANPVLLRMLGYTQQELEMLDLADLIPAQEGNEAVWDSITSLLQGQEPPGGLEGALRRQDGSIRECVLGFSSFRFAGKNGLILLVKLEDISLNAQREAQREALLEKLLQFPAQGALAIVRQIAWATGPQEVAGRCQQTTSLVEALLDCGAHPRNITRMVASVWDAATERLVALASQELGPAPARFAFVVLGSQGRQEQTLFSDQDSAIVYAATNGTAESPEISRYFVELGTRVCRWLEEAGHPLCRGNVMALNPRWCQPLHAWKQYFAQWIERAEPQELLEFSIFFDFRSVCGEAELAKELRSYVHQVLRDSQAFFPHFAQNSLLFKPPMRLFGRIVGGAGGEHPGELNLKDAMMPIVNFARLYALRHEINETNTLDRLDTLARQDLLAESSRQEITAAYDFLMRLRLSHQVAASRAGHPLDNTINYRKLGQTDQTLLKQAFAQIDAVQKKISYDFLGGTQ